MFQKDDRRVHKEANATNWWFGYICSSNSGYFNIFTSRKEIISIIIGGTVIVIGAL